MKVYVLFLLAVVAVAVCGLTALNHPVHAQSPAPNYVCTFGNGGIGNTSPCTQYIVNVSSARLGGGVFVYQVQSSPVDVSTMSVLTGTAGTISATSVQEPTPNNASTFTLSVVQP